MRDATTGVTSDVIKRVYEHKYADVEGFTKKYACKYLVYDELTEKMLSAIAREKQLKSGSRKRSLDCFVATLLATTASKIVPYRGKFRRLCAPGQKELLPPNIGGKSSNVSSNL